MMTCNTAVAKGGCTGYIQVYQVPRAPPGPRPCPAFQSRNRAYIPQLPSPPLFRWHLKLGPWYLENGKGNLPPDVGDV